MNLNIIPMTAEEYGCHGDALNLRYATRETPFGLLAVAASGKGFCAAEIIERKDMAVEALRRCFPRATFIHTATLPGTSTLHVMGTPFQIKVWRTLLDLKCGQTRCYAEIASAAGSPKAARAVGNAMAANPVAVLIPCHRVINADGSLGRYRWGAHLKELILRDEALLSTEKQHIIPM